MDASANAGFTTSEPWLPATDIGACNVEVQHEDERSLLALYRRLMGSRKDEPVLRAGSYEALDGGGKLLAFCRSLDGRKIFVALNFANAEEEVALPDAGRMRLSTHLDRQDECADGSVRLRPHEGIILEIGGGRT